MNFSGHILNKLLPCHELHQKSIKINHPIYREFCPAPFMAHSWVRFQERLLTPCKGPDFRDGDAFWILEISKLFVKMCVRTPEKEQMTAGCICSNSLIIFSLQQIIIFAIPTWSAAKNDCIKVNSLKVSST